MSSGLRNEHFSSCSDIRRVNDAIFFTMEILILPEIEKLKKVSFTYFLFIALTMNAHKFVQQPWRVSKKETKNGTFLANHNSILTFAKTKDILEAFLSLDCSNIYLSENLQGKMVTFFWPSKLGKNQICLTPFSIICSYLPIFTNPSDRNGFFSITSIRCPNQKKRHVIDCFAYFNNLVSNKHDWGP